MRANQRQIKIGLYATSTGSNSSAWRHPNAVADLAANMKAEIRMAQMAERALMDFVFLADSTTMRGHAWDLLARGSHSYVAQFEPVTLLSALAAVTEHIGLVATSNTTYEEPYSLARRFASLDLLSGGRAGWNLVTSSNLEEATNFNTAEHPNHAKRYERALEFAEVCRKLWFTWDENAFPRDKQGGLFFDPGKLRLASHQGEHFSVRGPLNVPPSPQRHPVMVQAGASEPGKDMAARLAEVIFTSQDTLERAQAFYADVKGQMAQYDRRPEELLIMPGVTIYVASTEAEANAKKEEVLALVDPIVGRSMLQHMMEDVLDLSKYGDDDLLPLDMPITKGNRSYQQRYLQMTREGKTVRDIYQSVASIGYRVIGTPEQVADELQRWFEGEAADGFIYMMDYFPDSLSDFIEYVMPELQKRGLYRDAYAASTLRENLGLALPLPPQGLGAPVSSTREQTDRSRQIN
ncbi:Nitrilotriacetate monooxygenase component A [Hyphomicrobiales bacterium]|nr:Nitrilotriacetate monooxygenase component A [Hyphomicrobiales bacterium]CAH1676947.1 Nitrilotriacetate monooxygenase component A [Hyphomicrobiales bacterium]